METVTGYVSHIVYRNSDNGYTVFHIEHDDGEVTCVGSLNYINESKYTVNSFTFSDIPNDVDRVVGLNL